MNFWGMTLAGLGIAFLPAPAGWEGLFGYVAGSLIVYAMAARRVGGWWC